MIVALRATELKLNARAGREGKGVGGKEFPPRPRFFAAAIFRISLYEMRRQKKFD